MLKYVLGGEGQRRRKLAWVIRKMEAKVVRV